MCQTFRGVCSSHAGLSKYSIRLGDRRQYQILPQGSRKVIQQVGLGGRLGSWGLRDWKYEGFDSKPQHPSKQPGMALPPTKVLAGKSVSQAECGVKEWTGGSLCCRYKPCFPDKAEDQEAGLDCFPRLRDDRDWPPCFIFYLPCWYETPTHPFATVILISILNFPTHLAFGVSIPTPSSSSELFHRSFSKFITNFDLHVPRSPTSLSA